MRRIAIINQKGGVGKTTTTANLGAALAIQGRRVVVVDMDAQANLSLSLGIEARSSTPTSYTVLTGSTTFAQAIRPTSVPRLSIVPANIDLSGAELELAAAMGREFILRDAIRAWIDEERAKTGRTPADYVLFDCPPSLGLLSINALACAGEVLITLQTEFLALQGMSKLVEVVQLLKKRLNPELVVTGIVPCLYDSRLRLAREVLGEIRTYFKGQVFPHPVRANVKLAEAPSFGQTVFEYAPDSNGADDYMRVAREVVAREGRDADLAGLPAFDEKARLPLKDVTPRPPPPRPPPRKPTLVAVRDDTLNATAAPAPTPRAAPVEPIATAPKPAATKSAESKPVPSKVSAPAATTSTSASVPTPTPTSKPAAPAPPRAPVVTPAARESTPTPPERETPKPPAKSPAKSHAPVGPAKPSAKTAREPAPKSDAAKSDTAKSDTAKSDTAKSAAPNPAATPRTTPDARSAPRVLRAEDVPPLPPDAFEILSILPTDS